MKMPFIAVGFAMFSMFFGSGNIVFPVLVGSIARGSSLYAILGLLVTAVFLPLVGLYSMSLFQGNYKTFFNRLGTIPAWIILTTIISLIGPFAVIPRCILISHAALETALSQPIDVLLFSGISCVIIYALSFRPSRIIEILGLYLTPVLLVSLFAIIICGLFLPSNQIETQMMPMEAVFYGLKEGYNTMDIFAAFLFSGVILKSIQTQYSKEHLNKEALFKIFLKSSFVGMGLLAIVYVGMCFVAARNSVFLFEVPAHKLLATIAIKVLGVKSGFLVCLAVFLTCLTTAISLSLVFSEFLSKELLKNRISYAQSLLLTMFISFFVCTLQFEGIQKILFPLLVISLPALILLAFLNILYKLYGVTVVKVPVYITFFVSFYYYVSTI